MQQAVHLRGNIVTHRQVTLVIGQLLDAITFVLFLLLIPATSLVMVERNAITGFLLLNVGAVGFAITKVGIPAAVLLYRPSPAKPGLIPAVVRRVIPPLFLIASYSGFVGACFNAYAIGQVAGLMGWI